MGWKTILIGGAVAALSWVGEGTLQAQPGSKPAGAKQLIADLGCSYCHTDLKIRSTLKESIPDLSSAGLRYDPAWLFEYLQKPEKVRQHLSHGRMPEFHLDKIEALALVSFLETQTRPAGTWPELPLPSQSPQPPPAVAVSRANLHAELTDGLICLACHTLDGRGGGRAVELGNISYRLRPDWVREYLVAPARFGVMPQTMLNQFYQVTEDRKAFREIRPQAGRKIEGLTRSLFSLNAGKRKALRERYEAVKASFPRIEPSYGETLFRRFNCAACHRHDQIPARGDGAAPALAQAGSRLTRPWVERYLQDSHAVRPFGYHPGDGSRMPNYRLPAAEAALLAEYLCAPRGQTEPLASTFQPRRLSAEKMQKAESLLREQLACLGCHVLGDEGGKIGPDLTQVGQRLQPDYVYQVITDPERMVPHASMPRAGEAPETLELLVNYLLQRGRPAGKAVYLSTAFWSPGTNGLSTAASDYARYCAACHGNEGRGNGFNAAFCEADPAILADATAMSELSDDRLYDVIASGGLSQKKSPLMPAWGETLSPERIRGLVGHIRTLCRCQGPADGKLSWSGPGPGLSPLGRPHP